MWQPGEEGSLGENVCMCIYGWSLCCTPETITTLLTGYTTIENKKLKKKFKKLIMHKLIILYMCCALLFSGVWLFASPWTAALHAPLSMGLSRQEYWSGLPCPPPGDLPNPGIEPGLPHLPSEPLGKGILPGQILKIIRTGNSFLYLFHFLPFGIGMSVTIIICLSHPCILEAGALLMSCSTDSQMQRNFAPGFSSVADLDDLDEIWDLWTDDFWMGLRLWEMLG